VDDNIFYCFWVLIMFLKDNIVRLSTRVFEMEHHNPKHNPKRKTQMADDWESDPDFVRARVWVSQVHRKVWETETEPEHETVSWYIWVGREFAELEFMNIKRHQNNPATLEAIARHAKHLATLAEVHNDPELKQAMLATQKAALHKQHDLKHGKEWRNLLSPIPPQVPLNPNKTQFDENMENLGKPIKEGFENAGKEIKKGWNKMERDVKRIAESMTPIPSGDPLIKKPSPYPLSIDNGSFVEDDLENRENEENRIVGVSGCPVCAEREVTGAKPHAKGHCTLPDKQRRAMYYYQEHPNQKHSTS
jgi:hypothetical protein